MSVDIDDLNVLRKIIPDSRSCKKDSRASILHNGRESNSQEPTDRDCVLGCSVACRLIGSTNIYISSLFVRSQNIYYIILVGIYNWMHEQN